MDLNVVGIRHWLNKSVPIEFMLVHVVPKSGDDRFLYRSVWTLGCGWYAFVVVKSVRRKEHRAEKNLLARCGPSSLRSDVLIP